MSHSHATYKVPPAQSYASIITSATNHSRLTPITPPPIRYDSADQSDYTYKPRPSCYSDNFKRVASPDFARIGDDLIDDDGAQQQHYLDLQDQAGQGAPDLMHSKPIPHKDSPTSSSQLRASKVTYHDLNARFMAADEERSRVSHLMASKRNEEHGMIASLMTAKFLAEAESQELYARRLRERVAQLDQQHQYDGLDRVGSLRLTDAPAAEQHERSVSFELDAGHGTSEANPESIAPQDIVSPFPEYHEPHLLSAEHESPRFDPVNTDTQEVKAWRPYAIAQLSPLNIICPNEETFTWEELHRHLGGGQYSPGLYFASSDPDKPKVLQNRTYWLLEGQYEPFAPTTPGQHGAKLTAFFNDNLTADGSALEDDDYTNAPVFICVSPGQGYRYVGQYSQTRYSDKLSHSELFQHVPVHVRDYWASQLANPHRPEWITEQLIAHFWPQPAYAGPMPADTEITTPSTDVTHPSDPERVLERRVLRTLERHALELRDWKKDARFKATLLSEEALMQMWSKSDMDEEKGLRLWWEYLECVGFDEGFYETLVSLKRGRQPSGNAVVPNQELSDKHRYDSFTTSTSTIKGTNVARAKRPADINVPAMVAFLHSDLQAAREMHDKATKAKG